MQNRYSKRSLEQGMTLAKILHCILNDKMLRKMLKSNKDKKSLCQQFSQHTKLNPLMKTAVANSSKRTS